MPWSKKIRVERTTMEFADIEVEVDIDDYREWLGGLVPSPLLLIEYLQSDSKYPANLPLEGATWVEYDVDHNIRTT